MVKNKISKNSSKNIIFNIIEKRLDYLWQSIDALDRKASTLIGFETIIVPILFFNHSLIIKPAIYVFSAGLFMLFISLFLAVFSIKSYKFRGDPKPRGLYEGYIEKEEEKTLEAILASIIESFEKNEKINSKKAMLLNHGFYFLFISLILIVISIYI